MSSDRCFWLSIRKIIDKSFPVFVLLLFLSTKKNEKNLSKICECYSIFGKRHSISIILWFSNFSKMFRFFFRPKFEFCPNINLSHFDYYCFVNVWRILIFVALWLNNFVSRYFQSVACQSVGVYENQNKILYFDVFARIFFSKSGQSKSQCVGSLVFISLFFMILQVNYNIHCACDSCEYE